MIDILALVRTALSSEASQAMMSGALVLSALAWLGYQARALPMQALGLIESQFTVTMSLEHQDAAFHRVEVWLSRQASMRKARRVTVTTWFDPDTERQAYALTAGQGRHFLFAQGRWFIVTRDLRQGGANGRDGPGGGGFGARQESLTITTWGRSQAPLKALLDEAEAVFGETAQEPTTRVNGWFGHGYNEICRRPKRPLDTLYLEESVKRAVIDDLEAFMARRKWYAARGIPWRRGHMLIGPPGCGKSSLIAAIAGHFNLPVFTINAGAVGSDAMLMAALNCGAGGVYAIEDIDSIEILKARPDLDLVAQQGERAATATAGANTMEVSSGAYATVVGASARRAQAQLARGAPPPPTTVVHVDPLGGASLTLSGFLNGIGGAEGRILIATTNAPDMLDPALLRAGRFDRMFRLRAAEQSEARAMFHRFFPDADADAFAAMIAPRLPMAQAELQNMMLAMAEAGDPLAGLRAEIERRFAA